MKHSVFSIFIIAASVVSLHTAQAQSGYRITHTFHIASTGGWDYVAVNPASNKLYVSHGNQVNILDKTTGDSLGIIPNTTGVHGIAFDNALGKGYTSNGRGNNVTVFELKTDKILGQIATGENPDAIMYDEFSKKIITCNGRSKDLTIIDPSTDKVVATIALGSKLETAVSDNAGKLYVNDEDKSEIDVIDMATNTVLNRWPLAPGNGPSGLAIDLKTKRLFSTCDKLMVIMDATNGKVIDKLPIGDGTDGAAFDPAFKLAFASNGEGTVTVVKEVSANEFKVLENVTTKRGARTITIDETTHKLYLLTADFEPLPAGTTGRQRPKMIPGTFQVLVLEK
jgi:YVTN family beta-propeller protein